MLDLVGALDGVRVHLSTRLPFESFIYTDLGSVNAVIHTVKSYDYNYGRELLECNLDDVDFVDCTRGLRFS